MRAIIYVRVSADRAGGRSVAEQESECRADCARNGWDVAEVICDNDIGASRWSKGERSGYRRLGEVLQSGDVLVTWEASRAQRDLQAYVQLRDLCAERGVQWSYSGRLYNLDKGDDRFSTGLDALLAEKSSEETRQRVLRAKLADAVAGRWPGGPVPFGYRRSLTAGIEPDPTTAPIMQDVAERVLSGESLRSIYLNLDQRGIRHTNGTALSGTYLARALQRGLYAAQRVHLDNPSTSGTWAALWSIETHRRLVALLSDPRRRTARGHEPKRLLTGIALCGKCGGPISFQNQRRGDISQKTYRCRTNGCVSVRADRIDEYVITKHVLPLLGSVHFDLLLFSDDDDANALTEHRRKADQLQERLDEFTDSAAAGELTARALARIEQKLLPEIAEERAKAQPSYRDPLLDALAQGARELWDHGDVSVRRNIIRLAFERITISPVGRGRREFDPSTVTVERSRRFDLRTALKN